MTNERHDIGRRIQIELNSEFIEWVEIFNYLKVTILVNEGVSSDVSN